MLRTIGQNNSSSNLINLSSYKPLKFESETTNQKTYKGFKLVSKPQVQTQQVPAVVSRAVASHFETMKQKDFVQHEYRVSQLDLIPYP
jgi:hypothetical protein